jgi:hypothetical protein
VLTSSSVVLTPSRMMPSHASAMPKAFGT